jgi:hypothetical protein
LDVISRWMHRMPHVIEKLAQNWTLDVRLNGLNRLEMKVLN